MKSRRRRSNRRKRSTSRHGASRKRIFAVSDTSSEEQINTSDNEPVIKVPSCAIMPARKKGESPPPFVVLPVKKEPVNVELGEMSSQPEAVTEIGSCSTSDTNICVPSLKIKEEPVDPGYNSAVVTPETGKRSSTVDDGVQVKKIKTEFTETSINISSSDAVGLSGEVVANQNLNSKAVAWKNMPSCFTDDSNSTDTVLNMEVSNISTEQNTTPLLRFIKGEQELDISADCTTNSSTNDGHVHIKKKSDDNTVSAYNSKLTEKVKTTVNFSEFSVAKLNEILANVPSESSTIIPQSSLMKSSSVAETERARLLNDHPKMSEAKKHCMDNKYCNSSNKEQLVNPQIPLLATWNSKTTSQVASSSNAGHNIEEVKGVLHLDFNMSSVIKALECISARPIKATNKILYPAGCDLKLTTPNVPNVEEEIKIFISSMRAKSEDSQNSRVEVNCSQEKNMDVDRILSPVTNQKSTLGPSSDKYRISSTIKLNSERPISPAIPESVWPVSTSSNKPTAIVDRSSNEHLENTKSKISVYNKVPSFNMTPLAKNSIASIQIPRAPVSAVQQYIETNASNVSDSMHDRSRNSVVNKPAGTFIVNSADPNRGHSVASNSYIGNESMDASFAPMPESVRSMNMGFSNNINYRNNNPGRNFTPTSLIEDRTLNQTLVSQSNSVNHLSLTPTPESRHRTIDGEIEINVRNNYQREHSSVHVPSNRESNKNMNSPSNVSQPNESNAAAAVPNVSVKRKISVKEFLERNKIPRTDNSANRSSTNYSVSPVTNSVMWNNAAEEHLMNAHRDPRLRRNVASSTTSPVAHYSVPTFAANRNVHPPDLNGHVPCFPQSPVITNNTSNALLSSTTSATSSRSTNNVHPIFTNDASRVQLSSTKTVTPSSLINSVSGIGRSGLNMHPFQSLPHATSNTSTVRASTPENANIAGSYVSPPVISSVSQREKLFRQNKTSPCKQRVLIPVPAADISALQVRRDSRVCPVVFPNRRGLGLGIDWHSSIGKKVLPTGDVLHLILEWNCQWLNIQKNTQMCPRICDRFNEVQNSYESVTDFYNAYFPLYMLNIWLEIFNAWKTRRHTSYTMIIEKREEVKNMFKISCWMELDSSEVNNFLKREEILYVEFQKEGKADVLFGYVIFVGTRSSGKRVQAKVIFHTAEDLYIPVQSIVTIRKISNLRVFLKQNDTMKSLEESPFRDIVLRPKEEVDKINSVVLPDGYDDLVMSEKSSYIDSIVEFADVPDKITLVKTPLNIDRTSFLSKLVLNLIERRSTVLVCLKDEESLEKLSFKILEYIIESRFVLAVKPAEVRLDKELEQYTLREKIKVFGREPNENEVAIFCTNILKECDVILTVISHIFFNEGRSAFSDSGLTCLIDDATSFTEPQTTLPLYYNVGHLVFIGDPSKEALLHPELQRHGYSKSLFSRLCRAKCIA